MRDSSIQRFSHFKSVYVESNQTTRLHVTSVMSVWVKTREKKRKNASYELSQCKGYRTLGVGKEEDGAGLHLHKRKRSGAQWGNISRYMQQAGLLVCFRGFRSSLENWLAKIPIPFMKM